VDPDAGVRRPPAGVEAEGRKQADEGRFEVAKQDVNVALVLLKVEDRIADELAWSVPGHVAPSIDLDDRDIASGQHMGLGVAAAAERDDRWVFEQEQRIRDTVGLAQRDEFVLEGQGFSVGNAAEVAHDERR